MNECIGKLEWASERIEWIHMSSKSGMIDVVVGISFFFFLLKAEPMLATAVGIGWLVSVGWSVGAFNGLPIPLQCIYIGPTKTMHTTNNNTRTHIWVAFVNLISAFLWLILLSWCIMNEHKR